MKQLCIKCLRGNAVTLFALRFGFKALLYYLLAKKPGQLTYFLICKLLFLSLETWSHWWNQSMYSVWHIAYMSSPWDREFHLGQ